MEIKGEGVAIIDERVVGALPNDCLRIVVVFGPSGDEFVPDGYVGILCWHVLERRNKTGDDILGSRRRHHTVPRAVNLPGGYRTILGANKLHRIQRRCFSLFHRVASVWIRWRRTSRLLLIIHVRVW